MSQGKRLKGKVKWFSRQKGFGFVTPDIGGEDLFVHKSSIYSGGFGMLSEGVAVEFLVEKEEDGRTKAVDITFPEKAEIPVTARNGESGFSGWKGKAYGGFVRGGGRISCYNCGEDGHFARECPQSSQGGGGGGGEEGGAACYNCGQRGHLARNCAQSNRSTNRGFGGSCYNCGKRGHLARDCNQERGSSVKFSIGGYSGGERGCYNCGKNGHLARDCSQERGSSVNVSIRGYSGGEKGCYNCGKSGHLARDCSQERASCVNVSIGGYSGGERGCYNCGERGHLARDCPNNDDNRPIMQILAHYRVGYKKKILED